MEAQDLNSLVDQLADLILHSKKVVVFTGAGVSTESGIPDFRGPDGIWTRLNPADFTFQKFISDPEARRRSWQRAKESRYWGSAEPNAAHLAIAELERIGRLDCIITQNIDGLHQQAGNAEERVFELHGTRKWVRCLSCGRQYPREEIEAWLDAGVDIPECGDCGGILKSSTIAFGEPLPEEVLSRATDHAMACDLCIVIGSSLVVYPAAYMPLYAVQGGAKLAIVNMEPTPMDHHARLVIREKAGVAMSKVLARVKEKSSTPG